MESNKLPQFELTLVRRGGTKDFSVHSIDKVEGDDLVHLLSQFLVVIASVQRHMLQEERLKRDLDDDDIPF